MTDYVVEAKPTIIEQSRNTIFKIAAIGFVAGLLTYGLALLLQHYVLKNLICNGDAYCSDGVMFSGNIASIVISIFAVLALVGIASYRPLLIVLASVVSLWGLSTWLAPLSEVESAIWYGVAFMLAYVTFAWLARIRNIPIMVIAIVVVVIALRVVSIYA